MKMKSTKSLRQEFEELQRMGVNPERINELRRILWIRATKKVIRDKENKHNE